MEGVQGRGGGETEKEEGMSFIGERSDLFRNQSILGFVTSRAALCNKANANNRDN